MENDRNQAPELYNDEQDEEDTQAHAVAAEAEDGDRGDPTASIKPDDPEGWSEQDLVDHMRDMESSGRIDMGAYLGEPNMDDNENKYAESNKLDALPGDGTDDHPIP